MDISKNQLRYQQGVSNTFHDYCYSVFTLVQEWIRMASKKLCLLWRLFLTRPKGWTLLKASQANKPSFSAAAQLLLLLLQHAACSLEELLRQLCFLLLFAETLSYISAPIILVVLVCSTVVCIIVLPVRHKS